MKNSATSSASGTQLALSPEVFFELAPDGILIVDASGRIQLVNHQTEVLFGYERSTLMGCPVERLLPERFHASHKRHRAHFMSTPHTRPMGTSLKLFGRRRDGSEFPVEVSLSPVPAENGPVVMAIVRDVTERTRLEQERLTLLQMVLDNLPGGAYLVRGPLARLVIANRAAQQVWGATWSEGWSFAEFLQRSGVSYCAETGQPLPLDALITMQVVHGGPSVGQQREIVRRPDGTRLPIL